MVYVVESFTNALCLGHVSSCLYTPDGVIETMYSMYGIFTYIWWFSGQMLVNIPYMEHLGNRYSSICSYAPRRKVQLVFIHAICFWNPHQNWCQTLWQRPACLFNLHVAKEKLLIIKKQQLSSATPWIFNGFFDVCHILPYLAPRTIPAVVL